jgi:hypothetical protein
MKKSTRARAVEALCLLALIYWAVITENVYLTVLFSCAALILWSWVVPRAMDWYLDRREAGNCGDEILLDEHEEKLS